MALHSLGTVRVQAVAATTVRYDEYSAGWAIREVTKNGWFEMSRIGTTRVLAVLSLALGCLCTSVAQAGPIDEAKGRAHLSAVAAGDLDALMSDYDKDSYMDWVGGALDGRYHGQAAIRAVWVKFLAANSGKPRPVKLGPIEFHRNPKGTTVQAEADYDGTTPVKVWHALVYRDGSLVTEIWQIDPAIKIAP